MTVGSNVKLKRQTRNAAGGISAQFRDSQHWNGAAGSSLNYPNVQSQPWKGAAGANAANPPKPSAIRPLFRNAAGDTATAAGAAAASGMTADKDSMTKSIAMAALWLVVGALIGAWWVKRKK